MQDLVEKTDLYFSRENRLTQNSGECWVSFCYETEGNFSQRPSIACCFTDCVDRRRCLAARVRSRLRAAGFLDLGVAGVKLLLDLRRNLLEHVLGEEPEELPRDVERREDITWHA